MVCALWRRELLESSASRAALFRMGREGGEGRGIAGGPAEEADLGDHEAGSVDSSGSTWVPKPRSISFHTESECRCLRFLETGPCGLGIKEGSTGSARSEVLLSSI
jgi:hypothetical protein